ncbi:MAG: YvcK family protein [Bacilli bacterium]|nr:YvcK family protein [Bacilli bacterium]
MTKLAVLGGGTGLSILLRGLKKLPFDISAIVSVCDDGSSTGRLRKEFNTPAVGDIRKVLISLSENEETVKKLLDYRFDTSSDLDGHALGNLLLTGADHVAGNMSGAIELINSLLNLKGKVIPLTEENVTLVGKMYGGKTVVGEHNITESKEKIKDVFYKKMPKANEEVLEAIKEADAIILSMGSLFTSIIPNLICKDVVKEIDKSTAKIIYVCNIMTQPGETDDFSVTDHVKLINKYLGKRKVDAVVLNNGSISPEIIKKYETTEQKDLVKVDREKINKMNVDIIENDYILIENEIIRHNALRVAIDVISYLLD